MCVNSHYYNLENKISIDFISKWDVTLINLYRIVNKIRLPQVYPSWVQFIVIKKIINGKFGY